MLRMGVLSVGGIPLVTVIRNTWNSHIPCSDCSWGRDWGRALTVMFSMVEIPRVTFSPDSAGMRKTKLGLREITIKLAAGSPQLTAR